MSSYPYLDVDDASDCSTFRTTYLSVLEEDEDVLAVYLTELRHLIADTATRTTYYSQKGHPCYSEIGAKDYGSFLVDLIGHYQQAEEAQAERPLLHADLTSLNCSPGNGLSNLKFQVIDYLSRSRNASAAHVEWLRYVARLNRELHDERCIGKTRVQLLSLKETGEFGDGDCEEAKESLRRQVFGVGEINDRIRTLYTRLKNVFLEADNGWHYWQLQAPGACTAQYVTLLNSINYSLKHSKATIIANHHDLVKVIDEIDCSNGDWAVKRDEALDRLEDLKALLDTLETEIIAWEATMTTLRSGSCKVPGRPQPPKEAFPLPRDPWTINSGATQRERVVPNP